MTQPAAHDDATDEPTPPSTGRRIAFTASPAFADLLSSAGATLAITTYQAGRVLFIRPHQGRLCALVRRVPKPMGLAHYPGHLALGALRAVHAFRDHPEPGAPRDARFRPARTWDTGEIAVHELACLPPASAHRDLTLPAPPRLVFVATRYNCLAEPDDQHAWRPLWRPRFISEHAPEDRCHLNGLAIRDGRPSAVTAFAPTNARQAWRENPAATGLVLDIESDETIAAGLAMPHSPRWLDDHLLVLESARGGLKRIDPATGRPETIATFPGFTRGLALLPAERPTHALVGLSRLRDRKTFTGLPLDNRREPLRCGVYALNLRTGRLDARLHIHHGATELFDVQLLPGLRNPDLIVPEGPPPSAEPGS